MGLELAKPHSCVLEDGLDSEDVPNSPQSLFAMAMLGLSDNNTVSSLSFISPKAGPFGFVGSLKTSEGKFIMFVKQRGHLKIWCK